LFEESSETSAVFKLLIVESNADDTAVNSESLAYVLSNEDENASTAVTLAAIALSVESSADDTAVNSESLAYVLSNEDENASTAVTLAEIALSVDCNEELSVVNPVVFVIVI
jgi:hypothetical protein